jgi:hypothetical protein
MTNNNPAKTVEQIQAEIGRLYIAQINAQQVFNSAGQQINQLMERLRSLQTAQAGQQNQAPGRDSLLGG